MERIVKKEEIYVPINCVDYRGFCGLCCYETEMILLPEDINDIEKLGFPRDYFVVEDKGVYRLRNIDGHCVFLDPSSNKCIIYAHRPLGCRLYPLVYDLGKDEVIVDKLCPKSYQVSREYIVKYKWVFKYMLKYVGRK